MGSKNTKALIIIGGHEDKVGSKVILKEVARRIGSGKLVITTVASHQPDGLFEEYEQIFRSLGVRHVFKLEIENRVAYSQAQPTPCEFGKRYLSVNAIKTEKAE